MPVGSAIGMPFVSRQTTRGTIVRTSNGNSWLFKNIDGSNDLPLVDGATMSSPCMAYGERRLIRRLANFEVRIGYVSGRMMLTEPRMPALQHRHARLSKNYTLRLMSPNFFTRMSTNGRFAPGGEPAASDAFWLMTSAISGDPIIV